MATEQDRSRPDHGPGSGAPRFEGRF
jgi:hypothetical protein